MSARILVTGGAGFIGSAVVRQYIAETDATVINVDALTYAGNPESLGPARDHPRHVFEQVDITDRAALDRVFREHRPDAVMNLAAESHVDRSNSGPEAFIHTNVTGTNRLLEAARAYWKELESTERQVFRFHHVSTDEVYGSLGEEGQFTEYMPYDPGSPYSASKAASDHLVRAWLFVGDHARALHTIYERGEPGWTYNVGGAAERTKLGVVKTLCQLRDEQQTRASDRHHRYRDTDLKPRHAAKYA